MDASAEAADAQVAPEEDDREGLQMQLAAAQDRDQAAQALRKAFLEAGADASI